MAERSLPIVALLFHCSSRTCGCLFAVPVQLKEKEKFDKLAAMGSLEQVLSDKYSRFDAASGEPTHDKEGAELDGKVRR